MSAAEFDVIEYGDDSDRWLAVGQHNLIREGPSVAGARVAVIETLRAQLLPDDEAAFATAVVTLLDAPATVHQYPIHEVPDSEELCIRVPIGPTRPRGRQIGTCAVGFGVQLRDHRDVTA